MTPPASIEVVPTVALIAAASRPRREHPPRPGRRGRARRAARTGGRSSVAPIRISAMLPACWPTRLPAGSVPRSSTLTTISPRSTPGHQRMPHRYSAAMPTPAGRPDGRDRRRVAQRLADLGGDDVGRGQAPRRRRRTRSAAPERRRARVRAARAKRPCQDSRRQRLLPSGQRSSATLPVAAHPARPNVADGARRNVALRLLVGLLILRIELRRPRQGVRWRRRRRPPEAGQERQSVSATPDAGAYRRGPATSAATSPSPRRRPSRPRSRSG